MMGGVCHWVTQVAKSIFFNKTGSTLTSDNVEDALKELDGKLSNGDSKSEYFIQYQLIGSLNYTEYIYSYRDVGVRSNSRSNGYQFGDASPILAPFTGSVKKGVFAIKGVAQSTGSPGSTVTVNFELWKVGFNGQGTKLDDIAIDIDSSQYTIGNWWNAYIDTDFTGSNSYDIAVNEGDLLALKFIRQQNNTNAVAIKNATVTLKIKED